MRHSLRPDQAKIIPHVGDGQTLCARVILARTDTDGVDNRLSLFTLQQIAISELAETCRANICAFHKLRPATKTARVRASATEPSHSEPLQAEVTVFLR